jgi:hypothetical protein
MHLLIFSMLAAGGSLDAFDDANFSLTTCAYLAFRSADSQNQSLAQFEQTLASRCGGDMSRLRELSVELGMSRKGMSRTEAEEEAVRALADFKASFASQYSKRDETREQLKALQRAVQEQEKGE